MVSFSELKFTDYHIALQNLAYLQVQDFLVSNHHIYRYTDQCTEGAVLKDFIS